MRLLSFSASDVKYVVSDNARRAAHFAFISQRETHHGAEETAAEAVRNVQKQQRRRQRLPTGHYTGVGGRYMRLHVLSDADLCGSRLVDICR